MSTIEPKESIIDSIKSEMGNYDILISNLNKNLYKISEKIKPVFEKLLSLENDCKKNDSVTRRIEKIEKLTKEINLKKTIRSDKIIVFDNKKLDSNQKNKLIEEDKYFISLTKDLEETMKDLDVFNNLQIQNLTSIVEEKIFSTKLESLKIEDELRSINQDSNKNLKELNKLLITEPKRYYIFLLNRLKNNTKSKTLIKEIEKEIKKINKNNVTDGLKIVDERVKKCAKFANAAMNCSSQLERTRDKLIGIRRYFQSES